MPLVSGLLDKVEPPIGFAFLPSGCHRFIFLSNGKISQVAFFVNIARHPLVAGPLPIQGFLPLPQGFIQTRDPRCGRIGPIRQMRTE
jgi:hypothetical protein